MMAIIHSLKCTVPFSFAVPLLSLAVTHCHSLSLFLTHFHSLSLDVPLVATRCTTRSHSMYHSSAFFTNDQKRTPILRNISHWLILPLASIFLELKIVDVFEEEENEILQRNMEEN